MDESDAGTVTRLLERAREGDPNDLDEAGTEGRPELRDEVLSLLRHLEPAELFFGRLARPGPGPS